MKTNRIEATKRTIALEVVQYSRGSCREKVIRRIDVSGKSERFIERVMLGMLQNMDIEHYYVREVSG